MDKNLCDFYFSEESYRYSNHSSTYKGKLYTEMVPHGKKPSTVYTDLKFVCTDIGDSDYIKIRSKLDNHSSIGYP